MSEKSKETRSVQFNYLKSSSMKSVYADGAWGGITPKGMISMALYNERRPIPRVEEGELTEDGRISEPMKLLESLTGVIRQVECEVFMTPEVAKVLGEWLVSHAENAIELKAKAQKKGK